MFAGWLVASMVWLNHAARDTVTRFFIVFAIMFLVPAADLYHCIIGSLEAFYLVFQGEATVVEALRFFGIVVVGNTVGGVTLVALLNYGQTRQKRFPNRKVNELSLTWREFMFGVGRGREARPEAGNAPLTADPNIEGAKTGSMLDQQLPDTEPAAEPAI